MKVDREGIFWDFFWYRAERLTTAEFGWDGRLILKFLATCVAKFDAQEDTSRKWVTRVSLWEEKGDLPSMRAQAQGEPMEAMKIRKGLR